MMEPTAELSLFGPKNPFSGPSLKETIRTRFGVYWQDTGLSAVRGRYVKDVMLTGSTTAVNSLTLNSLSNKGVGTNIMTWGNCAGLQSHKASGCMVAA